MTLNRVIKFWNWFNEQRGPLSIRKIEERARCPRGRIGNPYSAGREPTELICESIAKGLGISKIEVLEQAEIIVFGRGKTEEEIKWLEKMRSLRDENRRKVFEYTDGLRLLEQRTQHKVKNSRDDQE